MRDLYGVIGDPIAHSLSPAMHNEAFRALGIDADYHAFHVTPENLEAAVNGMKAIGVAGFNVTIPHKQAIMPYLDEIDLLAETIGAVNTVVRTPHGWAGYNTDGPGFMQALKEESGRVISGEKVLVIGAGGAARAIYYTLCREGAVTVDLCNRTVKKAEEMRDESPFPCPSKVLTLKEAEEQLGEYTLIVQTTSIGMHPDTEAQPLSVRHLKPGAFVSDIIYNPFETKFLNEAKKRGARVQNGLGMFIYQGAIAFEKWTGVKPDTRKMKNVVESILGGNSC
ncbi:MULTISPECIES: shikimate dehydrogenase [Heyndrickxia]|nr:MULTISPECIES: shikimate dehydrogenase [Heyndrickxia]